MKALYLAVLFLLSFAAAGADYFVGVKGKDSNPGTAARPFATFAKAVSRMKGGDSLNILPGVYYEPLNAEFLPTSKTKRTTIRAVIPGTVLIRGDADAPPFHQSPRHLFHLRLPLERSC